MAKRQTSENPHSTTGSVLDDLGFSPAEALEIRVKGELHRDLLRIIQAKGLTQQQLADLLDLHQPDVSHLLNGRISKFSMGQLIRLAGRLNLNAQVKLTRLRTTRPIALNAPRKAQRHTRTAA